MMLRQRNVFHLLHILAEGLRMTRRRGERQAIIGFESSGLTLFILFLHVLYILSTIKLYQNILCIIP
jgi:hypothetical protein